MMRLANLNATEFAAACYLCLVGYALLCPATGTGVYDTTLFGTPSRASMWMFVGIMFLMGLLLLPRKNPILKGSAFTGGIPVLFSIVVMLRSLPMGLDEQALAAANISLGPFCFVICHLFLSRSRVFAGFPRLLFAVLIAYGLIVCDAIFLPNRIQINETAYHYGNVQRLCVVFGHPNHLGNLLAFGVVLSFASAVLAPTVTSRLALWTLLASLLIGLISTYSRGAWLGCLTGLSACVIYLWRRASHCRLGMSLIALALIAVGATWISGSPQSVKDRWAKSLPSDDASSGNRLILWHRTSGIICDNWLVGVGIGRFGQSLDDIVESEGEQRRRYDSALNNYLTLAAEAGVPVSILYVACVVYASVLASRNIVRDGSTTGVNVGLLCGAFSMLVFGLTTYTLARVYASVLLWSALGYVVSQDPCTRMQNRLQPSGHASVSITE